MCWLENNVVDSGEQRRDSAVLVHVSILPQTPLPSRLLSTSFTREREEPSPIHLRRSSLYPPEWFTFSFFYRATAFGILNGLCKFGAILGNTIFASFVGITKVVPILLAATTLVGGGLIALRLPETREQVLMWTTYWGKEMLEEPRLGTSTVPTLPVAVQRTPG